MEGCEYSSLDQDWRESRKEIDGVEMSVERGLLLLLKNVL